MESNLSDLVKRYVDYDFYGFVRELRTQTVSISSSQYYVVYFPFLPAFLSLKKSSLVSSSHSECDKFMSVSSAVSAAESFLVIPAVKKLLDSNDYSLPTFSIYLVTENLDNKLHLFGIDLVVIRLFDDLDYEPCFCYPELLSSSYFSSSILEQWAVSYPPNTIIEPIPFRCDPHMYNVEDYLIYPSKLKHNRIIYLCVDYDDQYHAVSFNRLSNLAVFDSLSTIGASIVKNRTKRNRSNINKLNCSSK